MENPYQEFYSGQAEFVAARCFVATCSAIAIWKARNVLSQESKTQTRIDYHMGFEDVLILCWLS